MADALILSGGIAKGAFGAGVLGVLLGAEGKRAGVDVRSLVAASSGALNAAYAAAALHAGDEVARIGRLAELWLEEASFGRVFEPSVAGVLALRGLSGEDKVRGILRGAIAPAPRAREVELRLVVGRLEGRVEPMGGALATTYEQVLAFGADTFEDAGRLEAMFRAVTASAAFPGVFLPVTLDIDGREVACIDGGAVNNTPLGYALEHPADIDRVFIVSPQPRVASLVPPTAGGMSLVSHLADMLVEERYLELRVIRRSRRLARGSRGGRRDALRITAPPYNEARKSSRLLFGRHGVRALRPGRSPARRQNAPSASRFMATLVVM